MNRKGNKKTLLPPGFNKVRKLGEGAGSVVWSVRHETTQEKLALKLATEPDPAHRLQREFAILERLDLLGIVKVKDFGEHEGCEYFTMELIEGKPVTNFFSERRKGKDFVELFLNVFQRAATILSGFHHEGIVHIDIKPANLLITNDGVPVLLDFGFSEDFVLSPTSEVRGTTLAYAAPELFAGNEITPAADIYSLGVIAYEILSGAMLGIKKSSQELVAYKLRTPPKFGKLDVELPPGLEALIFRMLNPEPGLRPSADEVIAEIEWLIKGEKVEVESVPMIPRLCFGGRGEEICELEKLVFDEKRIVLISGELGIGKTRLLRELRFRAILDGRNVLFIEGRGAHLSLVEYLSTLLGVEQPKIDLEKEQRPDKWSRYERVFQAVEQGCFDGMFVDAPVDLTEDELGLLGYLSRGFDNKLGFILSGVPVEAYPEAAKVELDPLDEAEVQSIVIKTFEGLKEKDKLTATLVSVAKGNPARMNELLHLLHSEGWLTWKRGWVYEPGKDEKGLVEKLEGWLGERIEKLDVDSKEILGLLAVAESPLPAEVFTKITGNVAQFILAGLVNEGYIRTFIDLDKPHFKIQNDLVKTYALGKLSAKKKKSISHKLAETLEDYCLQFWGKDVENWHLVNLIQVATLYFKAGERKKAPRYLVAAGKRLSAVYDLSKARGLLNCALKCEPKVEVKKTILLELGKIAFDEMNHKQAGEYYTQMLKLLEDDSEEKAEILLNIGHSYQQRGDLNRANLFFKKAAEYLPNTKIGFRLLTMQGLNAFYKGELNKAQSLLERSFNNASSLKDQRFVHQGLSMVLFDKGDLLKAFEHAQKALELAEATGDKSNYFHIVTKMPLILRGLGRFKEEEKYIEKALVMTEEMNNPSMTAEVLRWKAFSLSDAGHHREALAVTRQALGILARVNDRIRMGPLRLSEAKLSKTLGDWEAAEVILQHLWLSLHKLISLPHLKTFVLVEWASIYSLRDKYPIALRILAKAKAIAEQLNDKHMALWIETKRCGVFTDSKNLPQARKSLEKCRRMLKMQDDAVVMRQTELYEIDILLTEGKNEQALELASNMLTDMDKCGFKKLRARVLRNLGKTLIATGKFEEGLLKLRESLESYKSREQFYSQGLTLFTIAEAMFEHGDYSDEGISALEEAEVILERLGAEHYLKKIKELREKHSDELIGQSGLYLKYLKGLKKINELINQRLGKEDFMAELLSITLGITGAERGMVFLAEGRKLYQVASQRIDTATARDAKKISRTIIKQLMHEMQPIYTSDATKDKRFNRSQSILLNKIRSFICVPLKTGERIIGTIYLDSRKEGLFNPGNLLYFETLGNLLAASIDRTAEYNRLQEELALARQKKGLEESDIVIGTSAVMQKLYSQIEKLAKSDTNVLLEGETGTGKGVIARMIHEQSPRREYEFCSINCGVLPENILEAELFGTRKGAYTGATQDRKGLLEAADCSTVFFDEVTNTSPSMQAKLLEVIEEKVIRRIGETKPRKVNLRFIFATNRDLKKEVKAGRFREDLYFRISTLTLTLPPLRDRKEDIPEFVNFFVRKFSKELNKDVKGIDDDGLAVLFDSSWPGNIRELKSVIERSVLLTSGRYITKDILKQHFLTEVDIVPEAELKTDVPKAEETLNLESAKARVEEQIIRQALDRYKTLDQAAKALGISKRSLCRKKKLLGL